MIDKYDKTRDFKVKMSKLAFKRKAVTITLYLYQHTTRVASGSEQFLPSQCLCLWNDQIK